MKTFAITSYIITGATLMLSSCSQEETPDVRPDVDDRRIVFHTSLPKLTTRAKEIVTELPYFFMTAFDETDPSRINNGKIQEYFDNVRVDIESGSDKVISDECIWPDPEKESDVLHFFAYYPALNDSATLLNATTFSESDNKKTIGYKIEKFRVAPDITEQVDFVTAYATGSMADNLFSGISLNFRHQLSRIEVKAWGANKSCDIEIAGVRIGGVNVKGNFNFNPSEDENVWSGQEKGIVEHIFRDEEIILLSNKKNSHSTSETAASIMGANLGDENNCAMVIPTSDNTGWNVAGDHTNTDKGMYISVLLRVVDKTPDSKDRQQYPYYDKSQGLNAMNIPRVVLAVDEKGIITANFGQLYKGDDGKYYTDVTKTTEYTCTVPSGSTVKEFGWAALPVTGNWEPGYAYTYTLDYTSGVGLHDPGVEDPQSGSESSFPGPKAGDPVISDRVGVSVSVNDWQGLNGTTTSVEVVPGS